MQQFTVPQFIDVEDKIIGPITARQFIILLSGALIIGIGYKLFNFTSFVVFGIFIFGLSGLFAFYKPNGMPFHFFILNFLQTVRRASLRVWSNHYHDSESEFEKQAREKTRALPLPPERTYNASRLAELSLIVDTQGGYEGEGRTAAEVISTKKKAA